MDRDTDPELGIPEPAFLRLAGAYQSTHKDVFTSRTPHLRLSSQQTLCSLRERNSVLSLPSSSAADVPLVGGLLNHETRRDHGFWVSPSWLRGLPNIIDALSDQQFVSKKHFNPLSPTTATSSGNEGARHRKSRTQKTSKSTKLRSPVDVQHERCRQDIFDQLGFLKNTDSSDTSHVFICWGSMKRCQILAIEVPAITDETAIWQAARAAWLDAQSPWRRWMSSFDARDVCRVKVTIAGRSSGPSLRRPRRTSFTGNSTLVDVDKQRARLQLIVDDYTPQEFPCTYDPQTGTTNCFVDCISYQSDFHECPEKLWRQAERQLLRLNMISFMRLAFLNPSFAACHNLIEDNKLLYSHQNLLAEISTWHCPRLGEIELEALYIDALYGFWSFVLPTSLPLLVLAVPLAKLIFKDWATAWGTGCFFVGLVALWRK